MTNIQTLSLSSYVRECGKENMEIEKNSLKHSARVTCEIPIKFLSFNGYVDLCRRNKYQSAKYKRNIEDDIGWYIKRLPRFNKPVHIHFHWVEENKRRDLDNICYAKKFILDALVKCGKLKDDSMRYVRSFNDTFGYGNKVKVVIEIREVE